MLEESEEENKVLRTEKTVHAKVIQEISLTNQQLIEDSEQFKQK